MGRTNQSRVLVTVQLRSVVGNGQFAPYRLTSPCSALRTWPALPSLSMATFQDFVDLQLRIGTVTRAEQNEGARDPALCLWIDLGDEGIVQSSAKITDRYTEPDLVGSQVVVVAGFEPLRVGGFRSDVLVIGALTDDGVVLLRPDVPVPPGSSVA